MFSFSIHNLAYTFLSNWYPVVSVLYIHNNLVCIHIIHTQLVKVFMCILAMDECLELLIKHPRSSQKDSTSSILCMTNCWVSIYFGTLKTANLYLFQKDQGNALNLVPESHAGSVSV